MLHVLFREVFCVKGLYLLYFHCAKEVFKSSLTPAVTRVCWTDLKISTGEILTRSLRNFMSFFGCKVGDKDKSWVLRIYCVTCVRLLTGRVNFFAPNAVRRSHGLEGTKRPLIRLILLFNKHKRWSHLYRARSKITELLIPTHAHFQWLKFIKNILKNSYMFRSVDDWVVQSTSKNTHTRDAPQAQTDPNNMICCHTTTLSIHTAVFK